MQNARKINGKERQRNLLAVDSKPKTLHLSLGFGGFCVGFAWVLRGFEWAWDGFWVGFGWVLGGFGCLA